MNKKLSLLLLLTGLTSLPLTHLSAQEEVEGSVRNPEYPIDSESIIEDPLYQGGPSGDIEVVLPNEERPGEVEDLCAPLPAAEGLFLVNQITYYINGQTKTWALEHTYKVKERTRFSSQTEMRRYFKGKERSIFANKIFTHVEFSYILEEANQSALNVPFDLDGRAVSEITPVYKVHLFVQIQDSFTFIMFPPIPRVVDGRFVLSTRITERNVAGSLMSLQVNSDFKFDTNEGTRTILPGWSLSASLGGIRFPRSSLSWNIGAGYSYTTEISEDNRGKYSEFDYHQLSLGIGSAIPLLPNFGYGFEITQNLRFGDRFHLDLDDLEESRRQELGIPKGGLGYSVSWNHSLTYSTIHDSTRKMRKGYSFGVGNNISYNFNTVNTTSHLTWHATFFQPFANDFVELSLRYSGFWNITGTSYGLGYIRGVRSNKLSGFLGNYINTTLVFTFWRWVGVWEAQIGLFLDGGITQKMEGPSNNRRQVPLGFDNFDIGTGIEGRLYVNVLRSFVIYGRLGINLKDLPRTHGQILHFWGDKYDFTIGFSLPY